MIDSSIVDMLIRMQGKSIAVKLDPKLNKQKSGPPAFDPSEVAVKMVGHGSFYDEYYISISGVYDPAMLYTIVHVISGPAKARWIYLSHHAGELIHIEDEYDEDDEPITNEVWVPYGFYGGSIWDAYLSKVPATFTLPSGSFVQDESLIDFADHIQADPTTLASHYGAKLQFVTAGGIINNVKSLESIQKFGYRIEKAISDDDDGYGYTAMMVPIPVKTFVHWSNVISTVWSVMGLNLSEYTVKEIANTIITAMKSYRYAWFAAKAGKAGSWWRLKTSTSHWHVNAAIAHPQETSNGSIGDGWFNYQVPVIDILQEDENIVQDFHTFIMSEL